MEYANTAQLGPLVAEQDRPYLARLGNVEEELARSAVLIEQFIARCRGGGEVRGIDDPRTAPKASGHFASLDRVVDAMARIDKAARELGTIG